MNNALKRYSLPFLILLLFCFTNTSAQVIGAFKVNGNAQQLSCNCYKLTNNQTSQSGSVWNTNKMDLNIPFDYTFEVYLGTNDGGADGIAFALQQVSSSTGGVGGGMGFQGITPSLGVLLDTYPNIGSPAADPNNSDDPPSGADHISINTNGDVVHSTPNNRKGPVDLVNIEDGKNHSLRVVWEPAITTYTVYFDDVLYFTLVEDIINTVFGGDSKVFWGFTGSTGGLSNEQRFCLALKPNFEYAFEGANACTGDTVFFTYTSVVFDTIQTILYDFGDGNTSNELNPWHVYENPGVYNVTMSFVDNNACPADTTLELEILETPFPVAYVDTLDCVNPSLIIDATGSYGTANLQYYWTGPGLVSGTNTNQPLINEAGTYLLKLSTDAHSCYDSLYVEVAIDTLKPAVGAGNDTVIDCTQSDIFLNPVSQITDSTALLWSGPGIVGDADIAEVQVNKAGNYILEVTDTKNGCVSYDAVYVNKYLPIDAINYDLQYTPCGAEQGEITINYVYGGEPTYLYSLNGSPYSTIDNFVNLAVGTYTIAVKDVNNCTYQEDVYIGTLEGITDVEINATAGICGDFGSVEINNVVGGVAPYEYSINGYVYQNDSNFYNLDSGQYSVYVRDVNGCLFSKNYNQVNYKAPTIKLNALQHISCKGLNDGYIDVDVTGVAPLTVSWVHTVVEYAEDLFDIAAGSYMGIVEDVNGCKDTININITEPDSLQFTQVEIPASCSDSLGWATVNVFGGTSPYTYKWSSNPIQTSDTATGLPEGNYTCLITDAHSCTDTAYIYISEPLPITVDLVLSQSSCTSPTGTAMANAGGGVGAFSYAWNTTPVQTTAFAQNLEGNTDYTLVITDDNDCSLDTSVHIVYKNAPSLNIATFSDVSCADSLNGVIVTEVLNGTAPFTYTFDSRAAQTDSIAYNLDSGLHQVIVEDAAGCKDGASQQLKKPDAIKAILSALDDPCGKQVGQVSVVSVGGMGAHQYQWNTSPVQSGVEAKNLLPGVYEVTVTDSNLCLAQFSDTVKLIPGPVIDSVTITDVHCEGGNDGAIQIYARGVNTLNYTWNTVPVQNTDRISSLSVGSYYCLIQDQNGCTVDTTINIKYLYPIPVFQLPKDTAYCNGDSVLLDNVEIADSYLWSTGETSQKIYAKSSGWYYLEISRNACRYQDTMYVREDAMPNLDLGADTGFCGTFSLLLDATVTGNPKYGWNDGSGNATMNVTVGGTYWVEIERKTCVISDTILVINQAQLILSLPKDTSLCDGETYTIVSTVVNDVAPRYQWNTLETSKDIDVTLTGNYHLQIQDGYCIVDDSISVSFLQVPNVDLGPDTFLCEGATINLNSGYPQFQNAWTNGDDHYIQTVSEENWYGVLVSNQMCFDEDSIYISVYDKDSPDCSIPEIFVANAFTPNNDGVNDLFIPHYYKPQFLTEYEFVIFDRWGKMVFKTQDINQGWDGLLTNNGTAKIDLYTWQIRFKAYNPISKLASGTKFKSGRVSLLR